MLVEEAGAVPEVIKFVLKFGLYPGAASGKGFNRGAVPGAHKKVVKQWFVEVSRMSRERFHEFEDEHKFDVLHRISLLMISIGYECY